ncbi:MAG: heme exporter protein CcmB [Deltaproteobacteria bacterium]|nr:heme exporter protein CcmB [Deltaproteobacteria bacterium]
MPLSETPKRPEHRASPQEAGGVKGVTSADTTSDARGSSAELRPPGFARQVWLIFAKDLRLEWRSREIVYTMALFSALLVIIFSFAFADRARPFPGAAGGLLWIAITFAGTLGIGRFFEREREGETIRALLLSPSSPAALYTAKLLAMVVFMVSTAAVVLPMLVLFFRLEVAAPGIFAALLISGILGFASIGTLFAAGLMRARSRDVMLGILTYPIALPVIIAGAKGTAALTAAQPDIATALIWLKLVTGFDVVFVVLSLWVFGPLIRGE